MGGAVKIQLRVNLFRSGCFVGQFLIWGVFSFDGRAFYLVSGVDSWIWGSFKWANLMICRQKAFFGDDFRLWHN